MSEIQIIVAGGARCEVPAELAVVNAVISADGPEPGHVRTSVAGTLAEVRPALEELQAQGALTGFTIDQVHLSSRRPWNEQGLQLPLVHTATIAVSAVFSDFGAAGRWLLSPGLTVRFIDWQVSETTRLAAERKMRQLALRDALTRAQDYADTLGLGTVAVREIREPGQEEGQVLYAGAAADAAEIDLRPADIEVGADIRATFTVEVVSAARPQ